jgi:hypothetical protein
MGGLVIQIAPNTNRSKPQQPRNLGPTVRLELTVTLDCELLDGDLVDLPRIAAELASYLERRDEHIGMIAASEWALLVRKAKVRHDSDIIDVALPRGAGNARRRS